MGAPFLEHLVMGLAPHDLGALPCSWAYEYRALTPGTIYITKHHIGCQQVFRNTVFSFFLFLQDFFDLSLPSCINLYGSLESVAINNQHFYLPYIPNLIRHPFQICLTCCVIFLSLAAACCPAQFQEAVYCSFFTLNEAAIGTVPQVN